MDDKFCRSLAEITGDDNFFTAPAQIAEYATCVDYSGQSGAIWPDAVIRPRHKGQLANIFEFCSEHRIPVAIRGRGCSNCQAARKQGTLLILSTGLDRIFDIDRTSRVIHIQAGMLCQDLARVAGRNGLHLPFSFSLNPMGTIGGAIAMDMANSLRYGPISNHVMRLGVFASDGRHFDFYSASGMPGRLKPGLAMADIFCGSQGSLGMIDDVYLKLPLMQEKPRMQCFICDNAGIAAQAVERVMSGVIEPEYLGLYDSICAGILLDSEASQGAFLMVAGIKPTLSGQLADMLIQSGAREAQTGEKAIAERRQGMLAAIYGAGMRFKLENIAFPVARLPAFLDAIKMLNAKYNVRLGFFGNAGLACFTVIVPVNNAEDISREVFALELMLNDAMTDESDAEKGRDAWHASHAEGIQLYQCIRSHMDPGNLLSPLYGI